MVRRPSGSVTFEGGLAAPFHRWFRLTPSFSPLLVQKWLEKHEQCIPGPGAVLDPFAGAGTTCIVSSALRYPTEGYEINPLLAFVSSTCLNWEVPSAEIALAADRVIGVTSEQIKDLPSSAADAAQVLGVPLPPIHNVQRWWRDDVLRELVVLRHNINSLGGAARDHLMLALAEIIYTTANITLGRLQLFFVDRDDDEINVLGSFRSTISNTIEDLALHVPRERGRAAIYQADSRQLAQTDNESISALFTSPPYPNRYSYVWNTRPHLYMLEFITKPVEAGDLDVVTLAGTWGKATSAVQKGYVEPSTAVKEAAGDILAELYETSVLMGNYVTKYFNDLDVHLAAAYRKLLPGAPVGYVVGNTETKGIMIETHDILASLMSSNGFEGVDQEVLRARNSGIGLTEVTVSARRPN